MNLRCLLDTNIASYYLRCSSAALEERVNQALRDVEDWMAPLPAPSAPSAPKRKRR